MILIVPENEVEFSRSIRVESTVLEGRLVEDNLVEDRLARRKVKIS